METLSPTIQSSQPKSLIVKSNYLINANYQLTPFEMKIIYLMAVQIKPEDDDFKVYYLKVKDLEENLNLNDHDLYKRLDKVTDRLLGRHVELAEEDGTVVKFPWVTRTEQNINNGGIIGLRFAMELRPHLLDLKERFTSFYDHNVLSLGSAYSMRMYEMLKQYAKIGRRVIYVQELREKFELVNKYRSYNMLKKKVVIKAQEDLEKHCDITFTFKEIKKSRSIIAWNFKIKTQRGDTTNILPGQDHIFAELKGMKLSDKQAETFMAKHAEEKIAEVIQYVKLRHAQSKVKNVAAYLVSLLKKDDLDLSSTLAQAKRDEEAEEKLQAERQTKKAQKANKKRVETLKVKYRNIRNEQEKVFIANVSEAEWIAFEAAHRNNPYFAQKLFKNGELIRNEDTLSWLGNFLGDQKLGTWDDAFIKWAYQEAGIQLQKKGDDFEVFEE